MAAAASAAAYDVRYGMAAMAAAYQRQRRQYQQQQRNGMKGDALCCCCTGLSAAHISPALTPAYGEKRHGIKITYGMVISENRKERK